jgi:hypothetical protein
MRIKSTTEPYHVKLAIADTIAVENDPIRQSHVGGLAVLGSKESQVLKGDFLQVKNDLLLGRLQTPLHVVLEQGVRIMTCGHLEQYDIILTKFSML